MSDPKSPFPIDPKEAAPAGAGFLVGLLIVAFFYVLAKVLSLPTFVEHGNIPLQ